MDNIKFNIEQHIATLSGNEGEVTKQLNIVSWNEKPPVIDVRAWSSNGKKPYKGISLSIDEAKALKTALNSLEMLK